ncbi:hypothetical protein NDA11_007210 [Ustilago hordei]|uniref:Yeast cell wall synthesis Kre9/Knh1-like N-terminal domain-containing protein n=1 Tax=Ustilago hordei TaxID=120017 RepID=I2FW89_USTHO|nr:uncharacterized protein UHO2_00607 [Ustilago hordei]KAJ1042172.1 hypothetical protein NDA10_007627 [Ustilago hordei]KAJ1594320.1 hypothetical protein NDA11_007210 [Ustilago hordei]UTT96394.1 hypothetical protein NDA17_004620 [Ustilago hordei]CCF51182.1 uncharacterized protein UHOR_01064 [Ustilago hordei]SYW82122.1 uncharacterized protein UHO2_00607 [Ustilago hordei]
MKFLAVSLAPWALVALTSVSSVVAMPNLVERQTTDASSSSAPSPLTPSSTNEGTPLTIQWDTTANQTWKSMEIKFMTGSNQNMTELYTVATGIDGTNSGAGQLGWTAPNVSPNANIYFFQFTHNGQDPTWTTRFPIADASGAVTAAPFARQPEGPAIPWGNGRIVSGAAAVSSSSSSSNSSSSTASASGSAAAASASVSSGVASTNSSASLAVSSAVPSQTSNTSSGSSSSGQSSSASSGQSSSASITARTATSALVGCVVAALAGSLLV